MVLTSSLYSRSAPGARVIESPPACSGLLVLWTQHWITQPLRWLYGDILVLVVGFLYHSQGPIPPSCVWSLVTGFLFVSKTHSVSSALRHIPDILPDPSPSSGGFYLVSQCPPRLRPCHVFLPGHLLGMELVLKHQLGGWTQPQICIKMNPAWLPPDIRFPHYTSMVGAPLLCWEYFFL